MNYNELKKNEETDLEPKVKEKTFDKELFEFFINEITGIDIKAHIEVQIQHILSATKNIFKADKVSLMIKSNKLATPFISIKDDGIKDFYYNPIMKDIIQKDEELKEKLNEDNYLIIDREEIGKKYPQIKEALLKDNDANFIMMQWCIDDRIYYLIIENTKIILEDKKLFKLLYSYFFFTLKNFLYNDSLYRLGNMDSLTGLYNRNKYNNDIANSYTSTSENIAVMYLDLDNMKSINDSFGHSIGDKLLIATAKILKETFVGANIYRIGGDEFVVICCNIGYDDFMIMVNQMNKRMDNGKIYRSFGISYLKDNATISEMIIEAETKMYVYKRRHHDMYSTDIEQSAVIASLKAKIKEEHFFLVLQPKINPYTNKIVGAEALVRGKKEGIWQYPNEFIPLFEKNNCIDLIDYFMLEEACKLQRKILDTYSNSFPISVNVSRLTLLLDSFEKDVLEILNRYSIPLELIHLEVTERMNVSSEEVLSHGGRLKNYGLLLEVDDFGSHFTNLNFLSKDIFSIVKIDKNILSRLKSDSITAKLIEVVIEECHKRNMIVLAEGVETKEELELIKKMNFDEVQGYYFDKPMYPSDFIKKYIEKR